METSRSSSATLAPPANLQIITSPAIEPENSTMSEKIAPRTISNYCCMGLFDCVVGWCVRLVTLVWCASICGAARFEQTFLLRFPVGRAEGKLLGFPVRFRQEIRQIEDVPGQNLADSYGVRFGSESKSYLDHISPDFTGSPSYGE